MASHRVRCSRQRGPWSLIVYAGGPRERLARACRPTSSRHVSTPRRPILCIVRSSQQLLERHSQHLRARGKNAFCLPLTIGEPFDEVRVSAWVEAERALQAIGGRQPILGITKRATRNLERQVTAGVTGEDMGNP